MDNESIAKGVRQEIYPENKYSSGRGNRKFEITPAATKPFFENLNVVQRNENLLYTYDNQIQSHQNFGTFEKFENVSCKSDHTKVPIARNKLIEQANQQSPTQRIPPN